MPINYEVTDEGPPSFTYPVIRAANVTDWKATFRADARTEATATDGQIIDLYGTPQLFVYQANVRLSSDSFVRTARGAPLDGQLDAFGLTRLPAQASVGQVAAGVVLEGDAEAADSAHQVARGAAVQDFVALVREPDGLLGVARVLVVRAQRVLRQRAGHGAGQ